MSQASLCMQLDVGNSGAKWRLVSGAKVLGRGTFRWGDEATTSAFLNSTETVKKILVSSVGSREKNLELAQVLENRWHVEPWFAATPDRTQTANGTLVNSYAEPARMGVDRWLAMLGCRELCTGAYCVVDVGSALTIDHVNENGQHLGGYIIPGPALMERALLIDTDKVRFDEPARYALSPGESTAEAVRHGIALAQAGAVSLALEQVRELDPALVYTGGAGELLMELVGSRANYRQDLVFEGLEMLAEVEAA